MSDLLYLPYTPRREDPYGHMVVHKNLEYLANVLNGLRALFFVGLAIPFFDEPPDVTSSSLFVVQDYFYFCNGAAASRSGDGADLFNKIGTKYGTGDGSTTFNVPDTRGRGLWCKGTHGDVNNVGDSDNAAIGNRSPSHFHYSQSGVGSGFAPVLGADFDPPGNATSGNQSLLDHPSHLTIGGYMIMYRLPF